MKKFTSSAAVLIATVLLLNACKKEKNEMVEPATSIATETDQEQFQPGVQGVEREYFVTLPFGKKSQKVSVEVKDNLAIVEGDIILGPSVSFEGDNAVAIDG